MRCDGSHTLVGVICVSVRCRFLCCQLYTNMLIFVFDIWMKRCRSWKKEKKKLCQRWTIMRRWRSAAAWRLSGSVKVTPWCSNYNRKRVGVGAGGCAASLTGSVSVNRRLFVFSRLPPSSATSRFSFLSVSTLLSTYRPHVLPSIPRMDVLRVCTHQTNRGQVACEEDTPVLSCKHILISGAFRVGLAPSSPS